MWPFDKKTTDKKRTSKVDTFHINRDGIVSLNLDSEEVQRKVFKEINKLKSFDDK